MPLLLEDVVARLKSLPPDKLALVSNYISALNKPPTLEERIAALNATRGVFLGTEGEEFDFEDIYD